MTLSHRTKARRIAVVLGLLGCSESTTRTPSRLDAGFDAPSDIATDALPDATVILNATATVSDAVGSVSLTAAPVRLQVSHPDGSPWFSSPAATPWLEVGIATDSVSAWHDPTVDMPSNIQWVAPSVVTDLGDGSHFTLSDPQAGVVTVGLTVAAPGVYHVTVATTGPYVALLRFNLQSDAGGYHGLGERFGPVDARGTVVPMQLGIDPMSTSGTNEQHVPVPFVVSTHAYGMFVGSRGAGGFDVASTDPSRVSATFEGTATDVYLLAASTPLDVIAAYTRLTGLPRLPPRWASGPMEWRDVWDSQAQMLADAQMFRTAAIPTTTMWIDDPWEAFYNDQVFDPARFPDPTALFAAMAQMGYQVLVWNTPYLQAVPAGGVAANDAQRLFLQAQSADELVRFASGTTYVSVSNPGSADGMSDANGGMIDFTSPAASAFWTAQLAPLVAMGVRGFKLDYGEDIVPSVAGIRPGFVFSDGSTERTEHSLYPQQYHAAYRAALHQGAADDGFVLVRASSWGGQTVCDVVWPGDLDNDFRLHGLANGRIQVGGLPAAIHGMMSLAASGFPAFGSDTGGYRDGMPTREAVLRWAEHTAFSPVMQLGGGGESHDPWSFTPDATDAYRALAQQHDDLVPYLRVQAIAASTSGTPVTRALALAYPDDPGATDGETYLLGPDLLVAPVITAGAVTRAVHIPAGTWVHWIDGTVFTGPMDVTVPAALGDPAVFVRVGAVVPLQAPDIQTLVDAGDPTVVSASMRQSITRARIFPSGVGSVTLEDGASIAVNEGAGSLSITFGVGTTVTELRAEVDIGHRGHPGAGVSSVTRGDGTPLTMAADAATVSAGCPGCWYYDSTAQILWVSGQGSSVWNIR